MCNLLLRKSKYLEEYKGAILLSVMNSSSQLEQIYESKSKKEQTQIEKNQRKKLMTWIIEVSKHLGVTPKHTQSVIILIDTILCSEQVEINNYQLLGITCFHMVSKYLGEAEQVKITDFLAAASRIYCVNDVLRLELHIAGKYLLVFSKSFSAFDFQQIILSELNLKKKEEEEIQGFINKLMMLYFMRESSLKHNILAAAAALIVFLELSEENKNVSKVLLLTFMLSRETQAEAMIKLSGLRNEMADCAGLLAQSVSVQGAVPALKKVSLEQYLNVNSGDFEAKNDKNLDVSLTNQFESFSAEF